MQAPSSGQATSSTAQAGAEEASVPKSAIPAREDNLMYCLAHLAAFDITPLHPKADILAQTRDNVQLLVNKVFGLKREDTDEGPAFVIPPEDGFRLPRQRPVPKVKPKTRWEKFMEERGMKKRKRSSLVFDEASGDWKRRWGYKSTKQSEDRANGIMEVKTGEDPFSSPFEKKKAEGKLVAAKQKMREVRNRVEIAGGRLKATAPDLEKGMRSNAASTKRGPEGLKEALKRAQVSSASFGKFDRAAPNEATNLQTKKRKAVAPKTVGEEKDRYLKAAGKVLSGDVDKGKAAKAGASGTQVPRGKKGKKEQRRSKAGARSGKRRR
jgi:regulator of ribosome biosynthesis